MKIMLRLVLILAMILPTTMFAISPYYLWMPVYRSNPVNMNWNLYYKSKNPPQVSQIINAMIEYGAFADLSRAQLVAPVAFVSQIIKSHSGQIKQQMQQVKFTNDLQRRCVYRAIWNTGTVQGRRYVMLLLKSEPSKIVKIAQNTMVKNRKNILDKKITAVVLDQLWASYFATGRNVFIKRIVSVLSDHSLVGVNPRQDTTKQEITQRIVISSAIWSLMANAYQDKSVYMYLMQSIKESKGKQKKILGQIVKTIDKVKFSNRKMLARLMKRAKLGNSVSQYILSNYYMYKPSDEEKFLAYKWMKKAADKGVVGAINNMGILYSQGIGVEKNQKKSVKYFRLAANLGDRSAMFNVGLHYFYGVGVTRNYKKSTYWFMKASRANESAAKYMLALMYAKGVGVNKDVNLAKEKLISVAYHFYDKYSDSAHIGLEDAYVNTFVSYQLSRFLKQKEKYSSNATVKMIRQAKFLSKSLLDICSVNTLTPVLF